MKTVVLTIKDSRVSCQMTYPDCEIYKPCEFINLCLMCIFTDNRGLCGIPGLPSCGRGLSGGDRAGIGLGVSFMAVALVGGSVCWWRRRNNILRAQQIAGKSAAYAKARTHYSRDIQMTRHHHTHTHTAVENGPILLS
ncbi:hypothetical protein AHAS_Ahas13G0413200 [Arachis hypogaea]